MAFEKDIKIQQLQEENSTLKQKISELEDHLKKQGIQYKKYYENHKDLVKQRNKEYLNKVRETNPEKLKERNHKAYLKRKEKLKAQDKDK